MSQFCTKRTAKEMEEESKKATQEALKDLKAVMGSAFKPIREEFEVEEAFYESSSDSEAELEKRRRSKKALGPKPTDESLTVNKLETRIHYLTLDLANAQSDAADTRIALESAEKRLNLFLEIDCTLASLGNLRSTVKNFQTLSLQQMDSKYNLLLEEELELTGKFLVLMDQLDFYSLKESLLLGLDRVQSANKNLKGQLRFEILMKRFLTVWLVNLQIAVLLYFLGKMGVEWIFS